MSKNILIRNLDKEMGTDWEFINAISNIVMAAIALISLLYSLYLGWTNRKQRQEDLRARLSISIVDWHNKYMLKVTNVGKETAYRVTLKVSGKPISENLYSFVREVFEKLSSISFCLEAGNSVFYLISPTEHWKKEEGIGEDVRSWNEIIEWLKKYDDEDIVIRGSYCDRYEIREQFSIREFQLYGSFEHKEAFEEIADAFVSRDPKDKNIQKNMELIAKAMKKDF